ncbi:MAG: AI-2E family transporter [Myxococcota bacterium]|nr:AI-2E family transporter [Myxococcota bacterium]
MTPPSDSATTPPPNSAPVEVVTPVRIQERRAFGFLALLALAVLVRLAMPVGIGLFLGALLGFTLEPFYARLRNKRIKAGPAALLCALGATLIVSSIVLGLSTLIVTRGIALLASLREQLAPGGGLRAIAEASTARLAGMHLNVADVSQRLENEAVSLGSSAAGIAAQVAGLTFGGLLMLFFMTLMAYFVLHYWSDLVGRAERMLPFERRHTHALLEQFRTVGREVLLGTVVTGLAQGVFAAVGYWMTGVSEPAFFGALTAVASLIPGVGTLLVWVPVGLVRIAMGHPGAGLIELIYSAATVGIVCDYLLRPRLVGREKNVPSVLTFIALFGGVEVFGVIGLILGPVLVALSFAILKTYEREATAPRASAM